MLGRENKTLNYHFEIYLWTYLFKNIYFSLIGLQKKIIYSNNI